VSRKLLTCWFGRRMLVVSFGIFHKQRRKIMALIPSKARAGIAAQIAAGFPVHKFPFHRWRLQ
jgi:hypothetical protein